MFLAPPRILQWLHIHAHRHIHNATTPHSMQHNAQPTHSMLQHMCTLPANPQTLPTHQPTNHPTSLRAGQIEQPTNQPTNNQPPNRKNQQPTNVQANSHCTLGGGGFHNLGGGGDKAQYSLTPHNPTQQSSGWGGCTANTTSTHINEEGWGNTFACLCMSLAQPLCKCTLKRKPHLQKGNRYPPSG